MRILFYIITTFLLAGCFASIDLATDQSPLSASDRAVAKKMSMMTSTHCVRYRYREDSGRKVSGDVKPSSPAFVSRFYTSQNSTWYMALVVADGVWTNVYLNTANNDFGCSEDFWAKKKNVRHVTFQEAGQNNQQ